MYRKNVMAISTTGIVFLLFTCTCIFGCGELYEGGPRVLNAYEVIGDCRKFEKLCIRSHAISYRPME
jgi:hypothetical protein